MGRISGLASVVCTVMMVAAFAGAQDSEFRRVDSPFAEEFDCSLGDNVDLGVEIGGLRWSVFRVAVDSGAELVEGKKVKTFFSNELENPTDTSMTLSIIILLEDSRGNQLERIELKSIKVGKGKSDQDTQKIKVDGAILAKLGKVYIFAEIVE